MTDGSVAELADAGDSKSPAAHAACGFDSLLSHSGYHPFMPSRSAPVRDARELDSTLDFMRLLWNIEHRLQSTSKRMHTAMGITGPQRLVLKIVGQFPGISANEVAHLVRLHPSTITGILQRLAEKGLLTRERDPGDGRRVRLRVRAAAATFTRRTSGTIEAAIARALDRMPPQSVRRARDVLTAIAEALDSE
jgi:MarR family transcriptional regulator, organic hydroperoxide resistance regulator